MQNIKPTPVKFCLQCGAKMERNRFGNRLEDMSRFKTRKYCSQECMAKSMIQDDVSRSTYQKRAKKMVEPKVCPKCGSTENLDVHHKDENWMNNEPENLEVLCHSCHMKHHWDNGKEMPKTQSACTICGKPSKAFNLCQKHYFRFKRTGNPLLTKYDLKASGEQKV